MSDEHDEISVNPESRERAFAIGIAAIAALSILAGGYSSEFCCTGASLAMVMSLLVVRGAHRR